MLVMNDVHEECPPTENSVATVKKLFLHDLCITVKPLSSETGISVGLIELILKDHLNKNKVSTRWVSSISKSELKKPRVKS